MRKWLAWQLTRLAYRLHDSSWYTVITPAEGDAYVLITNNAYGDGISAGFRTRWLGEDPDADLGFPLEWNDFDNLDAAYKYIEGRGV